MTARDLVDPSDEACAQPNASLDAMGRIARALEPPPSELLREGNLFASNELTALSTDSHRPRKILGFDVSP